MRKGPLATPNIRRIVDYENLPGKPNPSSAQKSKSFSLASTAQVRKTPRIIEEQSPALYSSASDLLLTPVNKKFLAANKAKMLRKQGRVGTGPKTKFI